MTTIACDGKTIAGDGQLMNGNFIHSQAYTKVFTLDDGRVAGFCGNAYDVPDALDYLNGKADKFSGSETFEAIILAVDGTAKGMDWKGRFIPLSVPCATGNGEQIALTAMTCGYSAFGAVEIAIKLDTTTGGVITCASPMPVTSL